MFEQTFPELFALASGGASPGLAAGPPLLTGSSNVWLARSRDDLAGRVEDLAAFGFNSCRVSVGAFSRRGTPDKVAFLADLFREHGIRAYIGCSPFGNPHELEQAADRQLASDARDWASVWAPHADVVSYWGCYNEINLKAAGAYDNNGRGATGQAAARAMCDRYAHATGVVAGAIKDAFPGAVVVPGGLGGVEILQGRGDQPVGAFAEMVVASQGALYDDGVIEGLDTHWYRGPSAFTYGATGAGATWKENPAAIIGKLLAPIGRTVRDTPQFVTECGVNRATFRSDEEAAAAMFALLRSLSALPTMRLVLPYTIWPTRGQFDTFGIPADTLVGDAVAAWAARPRG